MRSSTSLHRDYLRGSAPSYDALFSFAVFSEQRSFTRAARLLGISQPALFVQVKKLTAEVGVALYRRDGRALALTAAGERLAAFAREVKAQERLVLADVRGEADVSQVTLAAGAGALVHLLGEPLRRFPKDRWPLRILTANAADAATAVREARADLAVAALRAPPRDLVAHELRRVGQHVVVPEGHRLARRRVVRGRDLEGEALVLAPRPSPQRDSLEALLAGVSFRVAVEVAGWETMLHLARIGVGLAVVNDFCKPPRGTRAIALEGAPTIPYFLLERGALGAGAEKLAALVREEAKKHAATST